MERKQILIRFEKDIHKQLKRLAVEDETSVNKLVNLAVAEFLEGRGHGRQNQGEN